MNMSTCSWPWRLRKTVQRCHWSISTSIVFAQALAQAGRRPAGAERVSSVVGHRLALCVALGARSSSCPALGRHRARRRRVHPGRLKGRRWPAAQALPGYEAPACQRIASARFGRPEAALPDGWPQRAGDRVSKPGQHGARRLQAEVGGLHQQLHAGLLANEPAARVHSDICSTPNQVGLCCGWDQGRMGALACVPGAASVPEHDQSWAGEGR